ncbi:MAG: hypothetical protein P8L44_24575 [Opitutales bacterium]|nr:hypothetical protein [Opitutales bacterium]
MADDLPILRDLKSLPVYWPEAATGWTLQYSEPRQPHSWIDVPPEAEALVMQGVPTMQFANVDSSCSSASRSSIEDKNKNAEQDSGLNALPRVSHFGRSARI